MLHIVFRSANNTRQFQTKTTAWQSRASTGNFQARHGYIKHNLLLQQENINQPVQRGKNRPNLTHILQFMANFARCL